MTVKIVTYISLNTSQCLATLLWLWDVCTFGQQWLYLQLWVVTVWKTKQFIYWTTNLVPLYSRLFLHLSTSFWYIWNYTVDRYFEQTKLILPKRLCGQDIKVLGSNVNQLSWIQCRLLCIPSWYLTSDRAITFWMYEISGPSTGYSPQA